jgi:LL-diaminopimelate aminotransferase
VIKSSDRFTHLKDHFFSGLNQQLTSLHAAGVDVIRLDAGNPDLPPAPHILEALSRSAGDPLAHGYQPYNGTASLRRAWANAYQRLFQVALDVEREVLPLMGSKEGIVNLTLALVQAGDVVLVPDPGYMTYARAARLAGGEVYPLPLLPERGYLPDLSTIPADVLRRAKLMWLNYPNNPTAASASLEFFREVIEFGRSRDILVCHDAAYAQITFDGYRAPSLLQVAGAIETAVEFNTLSKWYNMAGWRCGAALGNRDALRALYQMKTNVDNGHFRPILDAAEAALTGDQAWVEERNCIYEHRRDLVIRALQEMGLEVAVPQASLYIWFKLPAGGTAEAFTQMILEKAHVSLVPGTVFGSRGEGFARLSLTETVERLDEAMVRMGETMRGVEIVLRRQR